MAFFLGVILSCGRRLARHEDPLAARRRALGGHRGRGAGMTTGRANLVAGLLVLFGAVVLTLDVSVG
jgi:hypothetical protein